MADLRSDAAREVSKTTRTLMQEILDQNVAKPELMGFNAWQKWRKEAGKRPTRAEDGQPTTSREEAALWRRTMASLYGESWREDLAIAEADEEEVAAESPAAEPRPIPQGALSGLPPGPPAVRRSGLQSWSSSRPGTPGTLTRRVQQSFDPATDDLAAYTARLNRQAEVLESSGFGLDIGVVDEMLLKAEFLSSAYEEGKQSKTEMLRALKREYGYQLLASLEKPGDDNAARMKALTEILDEQGVDTTEVRNRMLQGREAVTPSPKKEDGAAGRPEDLVSPAPSAAQREAKVLTTPEKASMDACSGVVSAFAPRWAATGVGEANSSGRSAAPSSFLGLGVTASLLCSMRLRTSVVATPCSSSISVSAFMRAAVSSPGFSRDARSWYPYSRFNTRSISAFDCFPSS